MREIKFRCWHNGRMIHQDELVSDQKGLHPFYATADFMFRHISNNRLMQFTGLLDKNGKEIWEGDILKLIDTTATVFYNPATASFDQQYEGGDNESLYGNIEADIPMEVIGNIYENFELIKSNTHEKNK